MSTNTACTLSQTSDGRGSLTAEQHEQLHRLLQRHWGYTEFRALQLDAVSACLAHRDSLTILPTGAGKSICFQLPALMCEGTALVVSPLIALMKDQVDALRRRGIAAEFVNSSLTSREREQVMRQMSDGKLKLLYIAPERLMLDNTLAYLAKQKLSFIAIDEAHCISAWGHDFRPDYGKLGELKDRLSNLAIHCFTATASPRVREDIVSQLKLRDVQQSIADMDRPNLMYRMIPAIDRFEQICRIVDHYPKQSGIVFCLTRKETERLAEDLRNKGYNAAAYHAGFEMSQRKRVQELFLRGQVDVIVATIAFGMGIDKPDIRFVIHNSLPQTIEHYLQECGRAGRDGLPSECVILYRGADRVQRITLSDGDSSERLEVVRQDIHRMANFAVGMSCRRKTLLASMGQMFEHTHCGACDNCLQHVPLLDSSGPVIIALLNAVLDTGERSGSKSVRQQARQWSVGTEPGAPNSKSKKFAALQGYTDIELEDFIEQILGHGLLRSDGAFCVLKLTAAGRKALQDNKCQLPLLNRFAKPSPMQLGQWEPAKECDLELFRGCLKKLSVGEGASRVPLPRSFAWQLASVRPTDLAAWEKAYLRSSANPQSVSSRLEPDDVKWIERICDWMQDYCQKNRLASNQDPWQNFINGLPAENETPESVERLRLNSASLRVFPFLDSGMSIQEVANASGLATSTVFKHLEKYIEARNVSDCSTWVPQEAIVAIEAAIAIVGNEKLKPIFDQLQEKYSYEHIRAVAAAFKVRQRSGSLLAVANHSSFDETSMKTE